MTAVAHGRNLWFHFHFFSYEAEALFCLGDYELRFDMKGGGKSGFAAYSTFNVASEADNFRLSVGGWQRKSTAGSQ